MMDRTATARMEQVVKIVRFSFKVVADGSTCLAYYSLLVRSKTFANAFKELSSASRTNS